VTQPVPNSAEHELTDNGPSWRLVTAPSIARETEIYLPPSRSTFVRSFVAIHQTHVA